MSNRPQVPSFYDATITYDVTLEDLIQAIREKTGFPDGTVEFDVSKSGKVRGATIKVRRTEIKG